MQANKDLRGNAYALKEFDTRGRIVALWPLNPTGSRCCDVPGTWELFYRIAIPGLPIETYPAEAIVHLRGMTLDGKVGLSPIAYHRETIGLGIAAQRMARRSSAIRRSRTARSRCRTCSTSRGDLLRAQWEQKFKGVDNAKACDLRWRDGVGPDRHEQHRCAVSRDAQIPEPANLWALSHAGAQGRRSGALDQQQHRASGRSNTSPTACCPRWCAGSRRSRAIS
jgi:hypothetical protein